ncbi:MAG: PAS domain S-box protein [Porticoccaceae bacterium]|nr:PAS domain S-box protein [Porticoccaceae bacterium]
MSLWATALFVIFQVFDDVPAVVDRWLLWISPLMVVRGVAGARIHHQLKGGLYFSPPLQSMKRMSMLFAISDGFLLLTALIIMASSAMVGVGFLVVGATVVLALLFLVYFFSPHAMIALVAVATVPALMLALLLGLSLPVGLILAAICVLAGTSFGILRFRRLLLRQLEDNVNYEFRINNVAESNYIFNQHWQKTPIAAIDWDQNLNIKSWNPAAEKMFGFSAVEALGQSLELIFSNADADAIRSTWLSCQGGGGEKTNVIGRRQSCTKSGHGVAADWYDTLLTLDDEVIGIASFVVAVEVSDSVKDDQQRVHRVFSEVQKAL